MTTPTEQPEALRLADECANFDASIYRDVAHANAGMLAKLQDAADEIRRLVAEREADRAVMREALEALELSTTGIALLAAGSDCLQDTVHRNLAMNRAAISSLKARTQ